MKSRLRPGWVALVGSVAVLGGAAARSQTVEGEDLMRVLQDAQRANESKYATGELWATAEGGTVGSPEPNLRTTVHLWWKDKRSRVEATQTRLIPEKDRARVGRDKEETAIHFIEEDDRRYIAYYPQSKVLRVSSRLSVGPPPLMSLRPDQLWYRAGLNGRPWIEMLGPHPNFPQQDVTSYKFTRLGDDRIQINRESKGSLRFCVIASLADDGNVLEFEGHYRDDSVEQTDHDTYRWARDERGRCYLASVEFRGKYDRQGKPSRGESYIRITIDRINLGAVPDSSLFEISSFNLPAGTLVEDQIKGRRYRIGDAPVPKMADSLNALIQEAKGRGLARPGR